MQQIFVKILPTIAAPLPTLPLFVSYSLSLSLFISLCLFFFLFFSVSISPSLAAALPLNLSFFLAHLSPACVIQLKSCISSIKQEFSELEKLFPQHVCHAIFPTASLDLSLSLAQHLDQLRLFAAASTASTATICNFELWSS